MSVTVPTFDAAQHGGADHILVIGAGVIGMSIALRLQRRGQNVLVVDRDGIAAKTSAGNAGAFAFSEIIPMATPGIMRKAPKWLFDPLGPLSIPPGYALQIAPWMLKFWRASWPDRYLDSVAAQSALMDRSRAALERLIADIDAEHLIRREGQLQLFEGALHFSRNRESNDLRRRYGITLDVLDGPDAIAEVQPGLDRRFTHGLYTPDWLSTVDPLVWVHHLAQAFTASGGQIARATVSALEAREGGAAALTPQGPIVAKEIVVAAGAWSHHLASSLGDHLPLETERGYNTTLPPGAFDIRTHLSFDAHGFVVCRIGDGVRVGGAVELGGLKRPPNFARADQLLNKARLFLPGLDTSGGRQWMGHRPSLPDSLPVIGRSPHADRVIYAFGHGHLGLTQSPGTAELVADLVTGQPPDLTLAPYAPTRFRRSASGRRDNPHLTN